MSEPGRHCDSRTTLAASRSPRVLSKFFTTTVEVIEHDE